MSSHLRPHFLFSKIFLKKKKKGRECMATLNMSNGQTSTYVVINYLMEFSKNSISC